MVVLGNTKTNHNYPVPTPKRIWVESGMKFLRNLTWQISVRWLRGTIKGITARVSLLKPKQHQSLHLRTCLPFAAQLRVSHRSNYSIYLNMK